MYLSEPFFCIKKQRLDSLAVKLSNDSKLMIKIFSYMIISTNRINTQLSRLFINTSFQQYILFTAMTCTYFDSEILARSV